MAQKYSDKCQDITSSYIKMTLSGSWVLLIKTRDYRMFLNREFFLSLLSPLG